MATDRSYRQLRNIQEDELSDEEQDAFTPLSNQSMSVDGGGNAFRGLRSQTQANQYWHCGRGRATCIIVIVLTLTLGIAIVSSMARPRCSRHAAEETIATPTTGTAGGDASQRPPTHEPARFPWKNVRLPTSITPLSYDIFLHPNLKTFDVFGSVDIIAEVRNKTMLIVLHSGKNLTITSMKVSNAKTNSELRTTSRQYNEALEQTYIVLEAPVVQGNQIQLMFNFSYVLLAGLQGFYRSTYVENGTEKTIATTQFEVSDARAAFPCFDEPAMKATFSLKMVREPQYSTLFNMPRQDTQTYDNGLQMDVFNRSLKMSTYLVAFVVSEFASRTYCVNENLMIGVHAPKLQLNEMDFALQVLNTTITFYEQYFGVAYPLPKQDMVAIPDFSAGAMENWGLITYRQVDIQYKDGFTSDAQKQRIAIVVTHELAHQWFGNLVTMKWWNDLWLNEGFASFVEYVGTNNWNKEWQMMDQFILYATHKAMAIDSLVTSHPISVNVEKPEDINSVFDSISYDKGASILRMLQDFLGQDSFLYGLRKYLKDHAYGNAETDDLWIALSNQTDGGEVKKMMDTWTKQKGYPVVNLSRVNNQIQTSQQQFFLKTDYVPSEKNLWIIPLTYITDASINTSHTMLPKNEKGPALSIPSATKWYKANRDQIGFYRVNYDHNNWVSLIEQLKNNYSVFQPADRASMIDDVFYLARSGLLHYDVALDLSQYLFREVEYVPVITALSNLQYIGRMLQKTADSVHYKNYMLRLIDHLIKLVQWDELETDSHLTKFLRSSILPLAVELGHEQSIAEATKRFNAWRINSTDINVNLKYTVYCAGAKYGLTSDWNFMWDRYLKTNVVSEKNVVMKAMACTTENSNIYSYLYHVLDGTVRLQDASIVLGSVASHSAGAQPVWLFLQQNWQQILQMFGHTSFNLGYIIAECTGNIASSVEYDQAKLFFDNQLIDSSGDRAIQQSLERMDINVKWLETNQADVASWLKKNSKLPN